MRVASIVPDKQPSGTVPGDVLIDALSALTRAETELAIYRAYWRRRQDALPTNRIPDDLEPHEIKFYEQFIAEGNSIELIPKDTTTFKSTNDFIWINHHDIAIELKSVQRARYDSIAIEIRNAVSRARKHNVIKDSFIIQIRGGLSPKLQGQLAQYNLRNPNNKIVRLWVFSSGGIKPISLE